MQPCQLAGLGSTLTAMMAALCLALALASPVGQAALAGGQLRPDTSFLPLLRNRRSEAEDVPCVYVPYLTTLKQRFVRFLDTNNDGTSTFQEVKNYLQRFKPNVTDDVVETFIRRRDQDGNGAVDFVPDYVNDMTVPDYTIEGARELFNLQDTNEDGVVDEEEIVKVGQALGASPEEAEDTTQGYYMVADVDKDGKLSFDEFKTLFSQ